MQNTRRVTSSKTFGMEPLKKAKSGSQNQNPTGKRMGDSLQDPTQKRRAAFGDLTNAYADQQNIKVALKKSKIPQKPVVAVSKPPPKAKEEKPKKRSKSKSVTRELEECVISLSQESLGSSQGSNSSSAESLLSTDTSSQESLEDVLVPLDHLGSDIVPAHVEDVDRDHLHDPVQVALYARGIFQYYKERELLFRVEPYMSRQKYLTSSMRAILVDWLVEVQENFELNHETLYIAVKLVDMYVARNDVAKEVLQLVGAAALFIASKFDERCPPLVEDFLYICDDAYKRQAFLAMERSILKSVDFDVGMPLSYRFLRRYAKCCKASMETLTLGRYILELSLMDYDLIKYRESHIASAALLLALRMRKCGEWTPTLEYYTGYRLDEILPLAKQLNAYVASCPKQLTTINSKYSHKVFYEVAKIPHIPDAELV